MLTRIESPAAAKLAPSPNYDTPSGKRSQLIVVHDVESPITQGYANTLASPTWFGSSAAGVSAHYICGPSYALQMVAESARAWHCGPAGNILSIGIEQSGYARYSRAQWLTSAGRAQIGVLARLISDISKRHGGPANPQRASDDQVRAYARGGSLPGGVRWCRHHDITRVLGGTTHTDPDPNYPLDVLQGDLDALAGGAPAPKSGVHVVVRGDTLGEIAEDAHTSVAELASLNKIKDPDLIYIGQKITLPGAAPSKPAPPAKPYTPPPGAYPLGKGNYFGLVTGPNESHGGGNAWEKPYVKWIQIRLHELGYAPGGNWADGVYERPTYNAVKAWQMARHKAITTRPGEVWSDDWRNLTTDR